MPSNNTFELALAPSAGALRLLGFAHGLALLVALASLEVRLTQCVAIAVVGLSWVITRRHPALGFGPKAVRAVRVDSAGQWAMRIGAGNWQAVTVEDSTRLIASGIALVLRDAATGKRHHRLVANSDGPAEPLRCLRAALLASHA